MKITSQLLVCVLFFSFGIAKAQNFSRISGRAITPKDQVKKNIPVKLLLAKDSLLVKIQLTDFNGNFAFKNLNPGNYLIVIELLGYKEFQSNLIQVKEPKKEFILPTIVLQDIDTNVLKEVVIQQRKPLISNKIDRTVLSVDALLTAAGGDALDVLAKSPGIIVDDNGTITFKGKSGVVVFIDDRPTYLSGVELQSYLKSLPASTLDKIELITNPPAKYEAAGSAGVINIITKKSKIKGINGSVTSSVSQGKKFQTRQGLNLNYGNNKVRIFSNLGYAVQNRFNDLYIFRKFKNEDLSTKSLFDQYTIIGRKSKASNAKVGLDYYVTTKSTIGLGLTGIYNSSNRNTNVKSNLSNANQILDSSIIAKNLEKGKFKNSAFNFNYRHTIDTLGQKVSLDFDYLKYNTETEQTFKNYIFQPNNELSNQDELKGFLPSKINIYAVKTDYSLPLKHDGLVEAGYKVSYSNTDNIADYRDVNNGSEIPNYNSSNHFKYEETINSAYANFNTKFKRFTIQTGLRIENTVSKGLQLGNILKPASEFKRNYTNFFPTLYVQYKLDSTGNNQVLANYGKRINRPYYQDLNPFISPLDKFTYYAGNPYLNASFFNNYELSYRYKELFTTTLSYGSNKDEIDETIEINNGIYYSKPGNIGESKIFSINLNADISFNKWWYANVYTELTSLNSKSKIYTENLNSTSIYWNLTTINNFKLQKSWSAEISASYQTKSTQNQFETAATSAVNFALQKKILKEKGSIKLAVNDIFYGNTTYGVIKNLRLTDAKWTNKRDSRYAVVSLTYGFGKTFKNKTDHEAAGADSEKNRVKV